MIQDFYNGELKTTNMKVTQIFIAFYKINTDTRVGKMGETGGLDNVSKQVFQYELGWPTIFVHL